jgi:hypothetical protein
MISPKLNVVALLSRVQDYAIMQALDSLHSFLSFRFVLPLRRNDSAIPQGNGYFVAICLSILPSRKEIFAETAVSNGQA